MPAVLLSPLLPASLVIASLALAVWPEPAAAALRYHVRADVAAGQFEVRVCTDTARERLVLHGRDRAPELLRGAGGGDGFVHEGRTLRATGLAAGECRRYRVDAAAAAASERRGVGQRVGPSSWLLAPAVWLWRPRGEDLVLRFDGPASASAPWPRGDDGSHRVAAGSALAPAWTAFGAVDERVLRIGGDRLRVATVGVADPARRKLLHDWVAGVARAGASVHGRLPLPEAQVLIIQRDAPGRDAVPWGQTARGGGAAVHLYVRASADARALRRDWVAAHELSHLFHPYLGASGRWLAEGLASYYQNVLRARAGTMEEAEAWRRLHAGFERGRRDRHDEPLAEVSRHMHRLGANMRTYWSGAALFLQADVELRRRGSSLDAVLGRFRACCLPQRGRWTPQRFVEALDRHAPGAPLFAPLHRRLAAGTEFPSLEAVYAELGLRGDGRSLSLEQRGAPLRRAIMGSGP